jgi:hypothetical protein
MGPIERETRFELATACLEGRSSTTELLPHESGRADSNRRPLGPKPSALTGLRYAPSANSINDLPQNVKLAIRFEGPAKSPD